MAKSLRSNNKKALRTVRRKKLTEDPRWMAAAEVKRQAAMERILQSPRPSDLRRAAEAATQAGMDVEAAAAPPSAEAAGAPVDAEQAGDVSMQPADADRAVTRSGIRLTKKKTMKLKRLRKEAGKGGWKQGTASSFHSKGKKKKRVA